MLAVSISVPQSGATINAAIADHVPVAELIPHLVAQECDMQPGQHWVLSRSMNAIRPEHTLKDAEVRPGELLTLDVLTAPQPHTEAVDQLTGPVGPNPAPWVAAGIVSLFSIRAEPLFHPLAHHTGEQLGLATANTPLNLTTIALLLLTALAAVCAAAGSLVDKRYTYVAALLGFGLGLNINVLCACVCAALLVWRPGPARVVTITAAIFASLNVVPGLTLLLALITLTFSGQIAIAVARIKLPRVPATGLFQEPVPSSSGNVIQIHSALVVALCTVIVACIYQLIPWGSSPSWWLVALALTTAMAGLSARGARPIHAVAVVTMAALILLWVAIHVNFGAVILLVLLAPAITVRSPMAGRLIDVLESASFALAIPLALHSTGLFEWIRGIG